MFVKQAFEDPAQAKDDLHDLFGALLAALVAYFDLPRWGRARHAALSSGACSRLCACGAEAEMEELKDITHEQASSDGRYVMNPVAASP